MKIAGPTLQNALNQNTVDPYFEQIPIKDKHGNPVLDSQGKPKTKKRRKGLPAGISDNDANILTSVKRSAYRLDLCLFTFCGIRFGWSSVIGFIPIIGDAFEILLAWRIVRKAEKIDGGLPMNLKMRMIIYILIDFAVGTVPIVGDLADAVYKCNTKNAAVLEKHLREQGAKKLAAQGQPVPKISGPVNFDLEEREDREDIPLRDATGAPISSDDAPTTTESGPAKRASWYQRRTKQPDAERGGHASQSAAA